MKRYLLFCQLALLPSFVARAQFVTGTDGLFIAEGTQIAIDGLTLKPSTDFSITSNALTISPTNIPGVPPSISRVYNFSQSVDFTGDVGFFYLPSELNGNTESTLEVAHGNATFVTTTGSTVNTVDHYVSNNFPVLTNFTSVTAAQQGALPVTLIAFTVKRVENAAMLNWQTSTETSSSFFEIQQSNDAKRWSVIGTVKSARESRAVISYSFRDAIRNDISYYRLRMVDTDGSFAYSPIRSLQNAANDLVMAYPNPVIDKLQVRLQNPDEAISLKVTDQSGRKYFESPELRLSHQVNMKNYPAGIYLIQVTKAGGSTEVFKIIKQ